MDLSVIIVSYNSYDDIKKCIESMKTHFTNLIYEIIVVNNFKNDNQIIKLQSQYENIVLLDNSQKNGFGAANNMGHKYAKGEYVCFMNPDIIVLNNILPLIEILKQNKNIGMIGPLLKNEDLSLQRSCYQLPSPKNWFSYNMYLNTLFPKTSFWGNYPMFNFDYDNTAQVGWISGAYMLSPKHVIDEIKGFDENFFMYCEDTDICWSIIDAGYNIYFSNKSEAIHLGGTSAGSKSEFCAKNMAISHRKLFEKKYSKNKINKMIRYSVLGSRLRAMHWKRKAKNGDQNAKNEYLYYKIFADTLKISN